MLDWRRHAAPTALVALAALIIHHVAYLVVAPWHAPDVAATGGHGHLSTQWGIVTPLAVLAAAALVVHQLRRSELAPPLHFVPFAAGATAWFLAQEAVEGLLTHGDPVSALLAPSSIAGVVVAPVIAALIVAALRQATELAARFIARPDTVRLAAPLFPRPIDVDVAVDRRFSLGAPRGPPFRGMPTH